MTATKTIDSPSDLYEYIFKMFESPTIAGFTVETTFAGFVRVRKVDGIVRIFTRVNPADDLN
jgi:hypothetical protein